jgi:hypothetical protein
MENKDKVDRLSEGRQKNFVGKECRYIQEDRR